MGRQCLLGGDFKTYEYILHFFFFFFYIMNIFYMKVLVGLKQPFPSINALFPGDCGKRTDFVAGHEALIVAILQQN